VDELDSADQLIYNNVEFHFTQVTYFQGSPQVKIDGAVLGVYGFQQWRHDRDHPFTRLELIPNGGRIVVVVGQWFEDCTTQLPSRPSLPP
jgi:hypothetical protein